MLGEQPLEVHVAAIHDVEGSGFRGQQIQGVHMLQPAVRE